VYFSSPNGSIPIDAVKSAEARQKMSLQQLKKKEEEEEEAAAATEVILESKQSMKTEEPELLLNHDDDDGGIGFSNAEMMSEKNPQTSPLQKISSPAQQTKEFLATEVILESHMEDNDRHVNVAADDQSPKNDIFDVIEDDIDTHLDNDVANQVLQNIKEMRRGIDTKDIQGKIKESRDKPHILASLSSPRKEKIDKKVKEALKKQGVTTTTTTTTNNSINSQSKSKRSTKVKGSPRKKTTTLPPLMDNVIFPGMSPILLPQCVFFMHVADLELLELTSFDLKP
jgi:hypothetical protein